MTREEVLSSVWYSMDTCLRIDDVANSAWSDWIYYSWVNSMIHIFLCLWWPWYGLMKDSSFPECCLDPRGFCSSHRPSSIELKDGWWKFNWIEVRIHSMMLRGCKLFPWTFAGNDQEYEGVCAARCFWPSCLPQPHGSSASCGFAGTEELKDGGRHLPGP